MSQSKARYFNIALPVLLKAQLDSIAGQLNEVVCLGAQHFGISRVVELMVLRFEVVHDRDLSKLFFRDWVRAKHAKHEAREGWLDDLDVPKAYRHPWRAQGRMTVALRGGIHEVLTCMSIDFHRRLGEHGLGKSRVSLTTIIGAVLRRMGPLEEWGVSAQEAHEWLRSSAMRGDAGVRFKGIPLNVRELRNYVPGVDASKWSGYASPDHDEDRSERGPDDSDRRPDPGGSPGGAAEEDPGAGHPEARAGGR